MLHHFPTSEEDFNGSQEHPSSFVATTTTIGGAKLINKCIEG